MSCKISRHVRFHLKKNSRTCVLYDFMSRKRSCHVIFYITYDFTSRKIHVKHDFITRKISHHPLKFLLGMKDQLFSKNILFKSSPNVTDSVVSGAWEIPASIRRSFAGVALRKATTAKLPLQSYLRKTISAKQPPLSNSRKNYFRKATPAKLPPQSYHRKATSESTARLVLRTRIMPGTPAGRKCS